MATIKELVFSKTVVEFAAVAKEYCAFIENSTTFKLKQFIQVSNSLLPLLYYKASLLPSTDPLNEQGNQKYVTEEHYIAINERIKKFFGQYDAFPEVFDERVAETDEQFSASIAEYLSDVYQDLKDFTMIYQNGQAEEINDALWECKLNFGEIWGLRLANCIRAIHKLAYSPIELVEEEKRETEQHDNINTSDWFISRRQDEMDNDRYDF